ncbi:PREDICTED: probable E3 ubiquitin-protein ligase XERICO [Nelumbo nucifera]|nr:PREDICTED: probable E3 ubiquitin-protein ligase XERICO [Nelumbo nucifera]
MRSWSDFLSNLYTLTIFSLYLLFEAAQLIQSAAVRSWWFKKCTVSTTQYLALVEEKHPVIRYKSTEMRPELNECAVCLTQFEEGEEVRELECKHEFHKECLDKWLQHRHGTCPLCRRSVLPEQIVFEQCQFQSEQAYDGLQDDLIFFFPAQHDASF